MEEQEQIIAELKGDLSRVTKRYGLLESKLKGERALKDEAKLLQLELQSECKKNKQNLKRLEQVMHNCIQAQFFMSDQEWAQQHQQQIFEDSSRDHNQGMDLGDGDDCRASTSHDTLDTEEDMEIGDPGFAPHEEKCEFRLDGMKVLPAVYCGMDLTGLLSVSAVEPKCREIVAKNQFFELHHLHKADDLQFTQQHLVTTDRSSEGESCVLTIASSSSLQNKQPKTRPEFYTLLYAFWERQCHSWNICLS